jgi:hypothetical protein
MHASVTERVTASANTPLITPQNHLCVDKNSLNELVPAPAEWGSFCVKLVPALSIFSADGSFWGFNTLSTSSPAAIRKKSSVDMPKIWQMVRKAEMSGWLTPFSHLLIAWFEIPTRSPNSRCVI